MNDSSPRIVPSIIVAVGVALAGWFVGRGFVSARMTDRYVTVKGISERQVKADLALWPIRVVTADNDLTKAQERMAGNIRTIREFLTHHGVDGAHAELQRLEVRDVNANQFGNASRAGDRYAVHQTLMVRSEQPAAILSASQQAGELVAAGIVLAADEENYGSGGPRFLFTKLNDLKPQVIQEATARARESASKFAQDSRSKLGGIRQASQGLLEILPRDQAPGVQEGSQVPKVVRVVSTVEYFLQD